MYSHSLALVNYPGDGYGISGAGIVLGIIFVLLYLVFILAFYALGAWLLSRVFAKAGIEKWRAWVPVYNNWVFLELGGQQGWLSLLVFVPVGGIVSVVFLCIAAYNIGLAFSKTAAWVVLYIFLPWVWWAVIGFDSSRWEPWRSPKQPRYGANVHPPVAPQS